MQFKDITPPAPADMLFSGQAVDLTELFVAACGAKLMFLNVLFFFPKKLKLSVLTVLKLLKTAFVSSCSIHALGM